MTAYDWSQWSDGHVPRQPEPVSRELTCNVCGGPAGDWRVIDERRWIVACPKCAAEAADADPDADYGDWKYHQGRD